MQEAFIEHNIPQSADEIPVIDARQEGEEIVVKPITNQFSFMLNLAATAGKRLTDTATMRAVTSQAAGD